MLKNFLNLIIISTVLASCTSLETLKRAKAKGDAYQLHLFELYKEFAENEAEKYDWIDSQHFINKAMFIVYGQNVEPEKIEHWNIPDQFIPELNNKRKILVDLIAKTEIRKNYAKDLAEAHFAFDCLLEEQEENLQQEDIGKCKNLLDQKLALLSNLNVATNKTILAPVKSEPIKSPEEILNQAKENFSYRIFFEFDSDKLTEGSKNALKKISNEIKKMKPAPEEVSLNGFTDKAGSEVYNLELSKKRATAVKKFLASEGISKEKIVIYAFGESDNAIETIDGQREPGSRRVEISIVD
ncbi:MAG: OmpA family protein [Sphingobacteriia bacterium]|nr:OmpA family protein [Sphingobacteriia bacterium]